MKTSVNLSPWVLRMVASVSLLVLIDQFSYGQATSGYIRFEERTDVFKMLSKEMLVRYQDQIEQYSSITYRLYFNPSESFYKNYFDDRSIAAPINGNRMRLMMNQPSDKNYYYTSNDMMITQLEALGKVYYMSDSIKFHAWKFGSGVRTILGYECHMAYYTDTSNPDKPIEVTAWYTSQIRPFIGPERFNTLPGGILALDFNNGERYWVARSIELRDLKPEEKITLPETKKNTKKCSYDEYLADLNENIKKQKAMYGGR